MDQSLSFAIQALGHVIVFAMLLAAVYLLQRPGFGLGFPSLVKKKSLLEQRLVFEAISAFAHETSIESLSNSVGRHLAEMTGFREWMLWLRDDEDGFKLVSSETSGSDTGCEALVGCGDERLDGWVAQNAEPILKIVNISDFAREPVLRKALARLDNGLLVPFLDGERLLGYIVLGGGRASIESRSSQFLSLFGAIVAVIIKKTKIHEAEQIMRRDQQRVRNLATLGRLSANLAHEIRNPLTFIKSAFDYMSRGTPDRENLADLNRRVGDEISRINSRIEQLLSLARVDSLQLSRAGLNEILLHAVRMALPKARESGIDIETRLDEADATISCDVDKLLQLFQNLLINGIQAVSGPGRLEIRSASSGEWATVEIEDTGKGIDPGEVDRIFEPFFTKKKGGSGLGLFIGFSVARAHGGSLQLLSTSPQGSCFRVRLPLEAPVKGIETAGK